jgi:16S rRNA (uracil1498-N3)-methyltransferase
MQRYFISKSSILDKQVLIQGPDVHHISHVMRFSVGDDIIVCDQQNHCYIAVIQAISSDQVIASITTPVQNNELPLQVDIAQALIRRERFEYMLQKATELGVHTIHPITMTYCVVKWNDQKSSAKLERWNSITKEASEQSHRSHQVMVSGVRPLMNLPFSDYDIVLVADETEATTIKLPELLTSNRSSILVVIGPEGGFHPNERAQLQTIPNLRLIGLGPRILRSETASSYILSVISYQYEMRDDK